MAFSPPDDDLTLEDSKSLEEDQIILQPVAGGKRKVSTALLSPPSSTGSLSSSASASVHITSVSSPLGAFELPSQAVSIASVEWCGFNLPAAQQIYHRYGNRPDSFNNPDTLLSYMLSHITAGDPNENLSPAQAMGRMGLKPGLQEKIMDPQYAQVRQTEKITFWAQNTIKVNWMTLLALQAKLKTVASKSRSNKKAKVHVGEVFPAASSSAQPSYSATFQSALEEISLDRSLPKAFVSVVSSPPAELPDHYTLYKAKAAVEMEDWIDEEDGGILITGLQTLTGGDFNFANVAYYWTPERETANQYHKYAANRCAYSEIWMLRIQVAKSFVDTLNVKNLWYGHEWKEFVWYSRKKLEPPAKYSGYWRPEGADVIVGHVCKSDSHVITKIKKADVQAKMTEGNLMTNPDHRKATQWAFIQYDSAARLAREIKGKIHIEITTPTAADDLTA
ncbi:MAG: hypothetical protein L6R41_005842 [Letrouitia leprolyta]|nr:MAG: hypothetical protein L6R41_005842 [Letrouitia leprolyta]